LYSGTDVRNSGVDLGVSEGIITLQDDQLKKKAWEEKKERIINLIWKMARQKRAEVVAKLSFKERI
jgi:hypothetical protein